MCITAAAVNNPCVGTNVGFQVNHCVYMDPSGIMALFTTDHLLTQDFKTSEKNVFNIQEYIILEHHAYVRLGFICIVS